MVSHVVTNVHPMPIITPKQPEPTNKTERGMSPSRLKLCTLRLAAWLVSEKPCQQKAFQTQLPCLYLEQIPKELETITARPEKSSVAGVVTGKLIRFHVL